MVLHILIFSEYKYLHVKTAKFSQYKILCHHWSNLLINVWPCTVLVDHLSCLALKILQCSLIPRPPPFFCSSVFVQYNTRKIPLPCIIPNIILENWKKWCIRFDLGCSVICSGLLLSQHTWPSCLARCGHFSQSLPVSCSNGEKLCTSELSCPLADRTTCQYHGLTPVVLRIHHYTSRSTNDVVKLQFA